MTGVFRNLSLDGHVSEVALESLPEVTGFRQRADFPRSGRLLKRRDFDSVYQRGKRHFSAHMTVFYLPRTECDGLRVGFTVGKILGGAVERNRVRRRMREAVRLHRHELAAPIDVVINPKKSALRADFSELESEISRAFRVIEKSFERKTR
jgi:ribonuclease P protein component